MSRARGPLRHLLLQFLHSLHPIGRGSDLFRRDLAVAVVVEELEPVDHVFADHHAVQRLELVDRERPETRERLIATVEEMQEMVEATLAFARGIGSSEPSETVDLAHLLADLRAELVETGAAPALDTAPGLAVRARPLALKRALRNVVESARRYGRDVRVALDRSGETARIVVTDHGPGIPEAELERVSEPYVRLGTSRSRETGGVGLGLSIARTRRGAWRRAAPYQPPRGRARRDLDPAAVAGVR